MGVKADRYGRRRLIRLAIKAGMGVLLDAVSKEHQVSSCWARDYGDIAP